MLQTKFYILKINIWTYLKNIYLYIINLKMQKLKSKKQKYFVI